MVPQPKPAALTPMVLQDEVTLALDCALLLGEAGPFPIAGAIHLGFADLTAETMATHKPTLIIMPLFGTNHDATCAIELLESLTYQGRIVVLAPDLPKPRLVERELQSLGPGPRLTLICP